MSNQISSIIHQRVVSAREKDAIVSNISDSILSNGSYDFSLIHEVQDPDRDSQKLLQNRIVFCQTIDTDDYKLNRMKRWTPPKGKRKKPVPKFNKHPCKCGAHLHNKPSSKQCPLNKQNIISILSESGLKICRGNIDNYITSYFHNRKITRSVPGFLKKPFIYPEWKAELRGDHWVYKNSITDGEIEADNIAGFHFNRDYYKDIAPETGFQYHLEEKISFHLMFDDDAANEGFWRAYWWKFIVDKDELEQDIKAELKKETDNHIQAIHKQYIDEYSARNRFLENIGCSKMFDCMVCMEQKPLAYIYTNKCACKAVVCNDCAIQIAKASDFGDYTCPQCRSKDVFHYAL